MEREEMVEYLKKKLTPKRFVHSVGVEYTAACMAFVYGEDVERARIAGLMHDCAKCLPVEEKLRKAEKHGLPVSDCERENPDLLHGKLGAFYLKKKFGIEDEEILSAISYHTTGKPEMTLLEKIIFVADYIEPNRRIIRELPEIRKEAFTDLDGCILHILKNTLEYLETRDIAIDDMTRKTYRYYLARQSGGKDSE